MTTTEIDEPPDLRLPRVEDAYIPSEKLHDYVLFPGHDRGRHKARVFSAALGIDRCDWTYLHDQLLENLATGLVVSHTANPPWGDQYSVRLAIEGLNGETHDVMTKWEIDAEGVPKLVTAYVVE